MEQPYIRFLIAKNMVYYDSERQEIVAVADIPPHPILIYNWLRVKHEILNQPNNIIQEFWSFVKKIYRRGGLMKPEEYEKYVAMYKAVRVALKPYLAWIEHLDAVESGTVLYDSLCQGVWDNPRKVSFKNFP